MPDRDAIVAAVEDGVVKVEPLEEAQGTSIELRVVGQHIYNDRGYILLDMATNLKIISMRVAQISREVEQLSKDVAELRKEVQALAKMQKYTMWFVSVSLAVIILIQAAIGIWIG